MNASRKDSPQLKERATRLALDARSDPATSRRPTARITDQRGIHREALRTWVQRASALFTSASALFAAEPDRPPTPL